MDLNKTLHRISHLKWLFLVTQVGLIAYCFIVLPDNLITMIGLIVYVSGIQLGLESLSDVSRMPVKAIAQYQAIGHAVKQIRVLLLGILVLVIISSLFISLKFVFGEKPLYEELFSLGLNCWALILGFLCLLKYIKDKEAYANSLSAKTP